jgi:hypothetical protein
MSESIFKVVVEKARDLIAIRGRWSRFALARTRNDRICDPLDPAAVRFCAHGALIRAASMVTGSRPAALLMARRTARRITGARSELEAVADLNALSDLPPAEARRRLLALFDAALMDA